MNTLQRPVALLTTSLLSVAVSLLLSGPMAQAAEIAWVGGSSTEWTDAANWAGGVVPGPADTALFDSSSVTVGTTIQVAASQQISELRVVDVPVDLSIDGESLQLQSILLDNGSGDDLLIYNDLILTGPATIRKKDNTSAKLFLYGAISGTADLSVVNDSLSSSRPIRFEADNNFVGAVELRGAIGVQSHQAFGVDINPVSLTGTTVFRRWSGNWTIPNDIAMGAAKLTIERDLTLTGTISGTGILAPSDCVLAGSVETTGQIQIKGGADPKLTGSFAHADIAMGLNTGGHATFGGSGTIDFRIADPSDPDSSVNDRISLGWGQHTPAENPGSVDQSFLTASGMTLALVVTGELDQDFEYPLVTWETMLNPDDNVLEASGHVQGTFTVTGLPAGWYLDYDGTALNPRAVVLAYGDQVLGGDGGTGLTASYFNNDYLGGAPALQRIDQQINFDWGQASPDPAVDPNDFSVRWMGKLQAPATDNYTLFVTHDDDARIWLDGELVLSATGWGEASTLVSLTKGEPIDIVVELVEDSGNARCILEWGTMTQVRQPIPRSQLFPVQISYQGGGEGLTGRYYANEVLDGDPILVRVDPTIDFDMGHGGSPDPSVPTDHFSIEWTGQIETQYDEEYTLEFIVDDGVVIWVDGYKVIDDWRLGGSRSLFATIQGKAGKRFPIRIAMFERTGAAEAQLFWQSPSRPRQLVPSDRLYPDQSFHTTIPSESAVSPVFFQGAMPSGSAAGLSASVDGQPAVLVPLTVASFAVDAPLSATGPVLVEVAHEAQTISASVSWTPTLVSGTSATILRQGDALLFEAPMDGSLRIDSESGLWLEETALSAGQQLPVSFTDPGTFTVVFQDAALTTIGSIDVTVAGVEFLAGYATEVGYTRNAPVPVLPSDDEVHLGSEDPVLLTVDEMAYDEVTGWETVALTAHKRGDLLMSARLPGVNAPIIGLRPIDEFTFEVLYRNFLVVNADDDFGYQTLVMKPYVPDVWFELRTFAGSVVFENGSTSFSLHTSGDTDVPAGLPPLGLGSFTTEVDPDTGETNGRLDFGAFITSNSSCFKVKAHQSFSSNDDGYSGGLGKPGAIGVTQTEQISDEDGVNPEICHAKGFKSLMFLSAADSEDEDNDGNNLEHWIERAWPLVSTETTTCDCDYMLCVEPVALQDFAVDEPKKQALFGAIRQCSDCKPCNSECEEVSPDMYTGTIPGHYKTKVAPCGGEGTAEGGEFWVSKLDAHGQGGTRNKFPDQTITRKARKGRVFDPVIQVDAGGEDGLSFYGLSNPCDKAPTNIWTFTAVARDPETNVDIPPLYAVAWEGLPNVLNSIDSSWTIGATTVTSPKVVVVEFPPGRHEPKLLVFQTHEMGEDAMGNPEAVPLAEPVLVGKAEIHSIAVEPDYVDHVPGIAGGVPVDQCDGVPFQLSNFAGGCDVDARLSAGGPVGRARVSLDGYPQNEYWGGAGDGADLYQMVRVDDGQFLTVYLEGYAAQSPVPNSVSLQVLGQAFLEVCDSCRSFKGCPVAFEWQGTDTEPFATVDRRAGCDVELDLQFTGVDKSGNDAVCNDPNPMHDITITITNTGQCPDTFFWSLKETTGAGVGIAPPAGFTDELPPGASQPIVVTLDLSALADGDSAVFEVTVNSLRDPDETCMDEDTLYIYCGEPGTSSSCTQGDIAIIALALHDPVEGGGPCVSGEPTEPPPGSMADLCNAVEADPGEVIFSLAPVPPPAFDQLPVGRSMNYVIDKIITPATQTFNFADGTSVTAIREFDYEITWQIFSLDVEEATGKPIRAKVDQWSTNPDNNRPGFGMFTAPDGNADGCEMRVTFPYPGVYEIVVLIEPEDIPGLPAECQAEKAGATWTARCFEVPGGGPRGLNGDVQMGISGKYQRVDIHGVPAPERSPTGEGEGDRIPSKTYVNVFDQTLSHSVTDAAVEVEGGEMVLELRRNVHSGEMRVQRNGEGRKGGVVFPVDTMLGPTWSTNLKSRITLDKIQRLDRLEVWEARVIDEVGNTMVYHYINNNWVPEHKHTFATQANRGTLTGAPDAAVLTFKHAFGTGLRYEKVGTVSTDKPLQPGLPPANVPGSLCGHSTRYYRLSEIVDRNHNSIGYGYANDAIGNLHATVSNPDMVAAMLPTSIFEGNHPERALTFTYQQVMSVQPGLDTGWRLTAVTDAKGRTTDFEHVVGAIAPNPADTSATFSYAVLDKVLKPGVEDPSSPVADPVALDDPAASGLLRPEVTFTYQQGELRAATKLFPLLVDLEEPLRFGFAVNGITDARGHLTAVTYAKADFPTEYNTFTRQAVTEERFVVTELETIDGSALINGPGQREQANATVVVTDTTGVNTTYDFAGVTRLNQDHPMGKRSLDTYITTVSRRVTVTEGVNDQPTEKTAVFHYTDNSDSNVTRVVDLSGNVISYKYGFPGSHTARSNQPTERRVEMGNNNPLPGEAGPMDADGLADDLVTTYEYDNVYNKLVRQIDAEGKITEFELDGFGNRIAMHEAVGSPVSRTTTYAYQTINDVALPANQRAWGFLVRTQDPDGRVTTASKTFFPSQTTGGTYSQVANTEHGYEVGGVLQDDLAITTLSDMDIQGNGIRSIDGNGNEYTALFDNLDRQVLSTKPAVLKDGVLQVSSARTYYDLNGNVVRSSDHEGSETTRSYDLLNRVTSNTILLAGTGADITTTTTYTKRGRAETVTAPRGNAGELPALPGAFVTTLAYDELLRLRSITHPPVSTEDTSDPTILGPRPVVVEQYTESVIYGRNSGSGAFAVHSGWNPVRAIDKRGNAVDTVYDEMYRSVRVTLRDGDGQGRDPADPALLVPDTGHLEPVRLTIYNRVHNAVRNITPNADDNGQDLTETTLTYYDDLHRVVATVVDLDGDPSNDSLAAQADADGFINVVVPLSFRSQSDVLGGVSYGAVSLGTEDSLVGFAPKPWESDIITRTFYDQAGNPVAVLDPEGNDTRNFSDGAGRTVQVQMTPVGIFDPQGYNDDSQAAFIPTARTYFDKNSNALFSRDANNTWSASVFDARDRLTRSIIDLNGDHVFDSARAPADDDSGTNDIISDTAYDLMDNVLSVTDPRGFSTTTIYDAAYRVTSVTRPAIADAENGGAMTAGTTLTAYDTASNVVQVIDARGVVTVSSYDGLDRAVSVTNALGAGPSVEVTTSTAYDQNGNVRALTLDNDGDLQRTDYGFDYLNRQIVERLPALEATDPDLAMRETRTSYLRNSTVLESIDAKAQRILTRYDRRRRTLERVFLSASGGVEETRTWRYDRADNPVRITDGAGLTEFLYDAHYRVTAETRFDDGRLPYTVVSGYDAADERTICSYPETGRSQTCFFDRLGRLLSNEDRPDGTDSEILTTSFRYDASSNQRFCEKPNGVTDSYTFDSRNQVLTGDSLTATGAVVYQTSYDYDQVGNRRGIVENTGGLGVRNLVYDYDDQYRLTEESWEGHSYDYSYDAAGNRLSRTVLDLNGTVTTVYGYDRLNRLRTASPSNAPTITYAYDLNGNRSSKQLSGASTQIYTWDTLDRLVAVDTTGDGAADFTASYDYRTRRVFKNEGPNTTHFRYDGGVSFQEVDVVADRLKVEFVRANGLGGGIGSILYSDRPQLGGSVLREHFCYNPVGHTVALTDNAGSLSSSSQYEAFGQRVNTSGSSENNRLANTKERDFSIGLDNHGFRYYDPDLGRYTSRDLIGYGDGMNVYAHVHNNPINFIDPLGLSTSGKRKRGNKKNPKSEREKRLLGMAKKLKERWNQLKADVESGGDMEPLRKRYDQYVKDHNAFVDAVTKYADDYWFENHDVMMAPMSLPLFHKDLLWKKEHRAGFRSSMEALGEEIEQTQAGMGALETGLEIIIIVDTIAGVLTGKELVKQIGKQGWKAAMKVDWKEAFKFAKSKGSGGPAKPDVPDFVYRSGGKSPSNLTPRPVDDGMLSTRDSLSNPWPLQPGQKPVMPAGKPIQVIDTKKLPEGTVIPDGKPFGTQPAGHVSIGPNVPAETVKDAVVETIPKSATK